MKKTLNSFPANQQFHTGFYSKEAYLAFKSICKSMNVRYAWSRLFWTFQNGMSEVVMCADVPASHYSWRNYLRIDWHEAITFQECMKNAIAKYADVNNVCGREIIAWAKGEDPVDADLFKKLIGTPENPIKAELNDLVIQEETRINEKFAAYRDEVNDRRFISPNAMFAVDPAASYGNNGYACNCSFAGVLSQNEMTALYDAEVKMHAALQAFIIAKNAYAEAFEQWHKVNRKTSHLLTVAKNKEIVKLKKAVK